MPDPAPAMMMGTVGSSGGWKACWDGRTPARILIPGSKWARKFVAVPKYIPFSEICLAFRTAIVRETRSGSSNGEDEIEYCHQSVNGNRTHLSHPERGQGEDEVTERHLDMLIVLQKVQQAQSLFGNLFVVEFRS